MQFFSKWRASQDEEERESSQAFQDDGFPVPDAHTAPAEQHHPDLDSARTSTSGEDVDSGSSPDVPLAGAGRPRRVSFEEDGPAAAPVVRKANAVVRSQNWRWLLQQEELKSLAELSAPSSSAPRTAAEKNEVRRRAAEELDLSSVKREELYLLSAEVRVRVMVRVRARVRVSPKREELYLLSAEELSALTLTLTLILTLTRTLTPTLTLTQTRTPTPTPTATPKPDQELGALDELAYGGEVLQPALQP